MKLFPKFYFKIFYHIFFLFTVLFLLSAPLFAEGGEGAKIDLGGETETKSEPQATETKPPALIIPENVIQARASTARFFNRDIAQLHVTINGRTPEIRAEQFSGKVIDALNVNPAGLVSAEKIEGATRIKINDILVLTLHDDDLQLAEGENKSAKINETVTALEKSIADYKEQRSLGFIKDALIMIIIAVFLFMVTTYVISFIRKLLHRHTESVIRKLFNAFSAEEFSSHHAPRVADFINKLISALLYAAYLVVLYISVILILRSIPYTRPWAMGLGHNFIHLLNSFIISMSHILPNLFIMVLILVTAKYCVYLLKIFFKGIEKNQINLLWIDKETIVPTQRLTTFFVWIVAIGLAYPFIPGSGSDAFKGLSVVVGLMLSLGSSNIISQAVSGLILIYTKSIRVGDVIKIEEFEGEVIYMGAFTVQIRNIAKEEISFPNSLILDSVTTNYTKQKAAQGVSLHTKVTIDYATPWRQIHAILLDAASRTKSILQNGKTMVWQTDLGNYAVEYTLVVWIDDPERRKIILTELNANVQDVFNEYGVQIMTPTFLEMPTEMPKRKHVVPEEHWYDAPALKPGSVSFVDETPEDETLAEANKIAKGRKRRID